MSYSFEIGDMLPKRAPDGQPMGWSPAYLDGFGDARHAAAEIAAEADARLEVAQRDFAALQRAIVGDTAASAILTVEKMRARLEVAQRMADALRKATQVLFVHGSGWKAYISEEERSQARAALAEWEATR